MTTEIGNICVTLSAVVEDGKILLLRRNKAPYKGYWGLIGGKLKLHESIEECALREVKEETGLDCSFVMINDILHERITEDNFVKGGFVLFLCTLKPMHKNVVESDEGKVEWFNIASLKKEECIPSDYYMIKNLLGKSRKMKEVVQVEKDGILLDMKIEER
jgi:8-oxo-dGTP diphosphatase